ncbi:hypothetical protein Bca4012_001949 [Brassica carinata]
MKEMRFWWSFMPITLTNSSESPSNSESARSLDEPMTSDEFEWKSNIRRNMLLDFAIQQISAGNFSLSRKVTKKNKLLLGDV